MDACRESEHGKQENEPHENGSSILQYTERHANARVECPTAFDHCICRFWIRRILMNRATDSQGIESTTRKTIQAGQYILGNKRDTRV